MKINQIYALTNQAFKQSIGKEALEAQDLTGLISMGKEVLSTQTNTENFCKAIADLIANVVIEDRVYNANTRGLYRNLIEFGAAIEEVYVEPIESEKNNAWDIQNGATPDFSVKLPTVKVKIYSEKSTWQKSVSIPTFQMKSAFQNENQMASFITGIYNALATAMNIDIENMANTCENNFIAELYDFQATTGTGVHAVNLLEKYNTATGKTLTKAKALLDPDFLQFAGKEIRDYTDLVCPASTIYNTEGYVRFADKSELSLHLLRDFVSATDTYLKSKTFHDDLVALPGFSPVQYWQGQGTAGAYADRAKIDVTTASGKPVVITDVIGVLFDPMAIGIMFDNLHSTEFFDPDHETTKVWEKADKGYFNNLSRIGVMFYIAD